MHTKAFPYIGLLSFLWGTNAVASRIGINTFDPYTFIALRLAIATLFFGLIYLAQRRALPVDGTLWRHAGISGLIGVAIPMTFFILSLQYQSSGMATIFTAAGPVMMVIAAHFFLADERMTRNKAAGVLLAFSGALFLVLRGESGLAGVGRASPLGFMLVFVGSFSEVANAIFVRRRMQATDPVAVTGIRLLTGATVMIVVALLMGNPSLAGVTTSGYLSLAYAALVGALAGQFLAFSITHRFGATAFSLTIYLVPVVATIVGVLLLGEIVTLVMVGGVALIGGGIYLINRPAKDGSAEPPLVEHSAKLNVGSS